MSTQVNVSSYIQVKVVDRSVCMNFNNINYDRPEKMALNNKHWNENRKQQISHSRNNCYNVYIIAK